MDSNIFKLLECDTVVLYDKTSSKGSVNEAQRDVLPTKQINRKHPTDAGCKASCPPDWDLDHELCDPAGNSIS